MQQEGERALQIRSFCAKRGIRRLVHFCRVENLERILREGLLSRRALEALPRERRPRFNDAVRLDGHREAICLSIEFPNAQMFHRYAVDDPAAWAVLCLDAAILWELECAFCRENASSNAVKDVPLSARKTVYALKQMFSEHYYDVRRSALWIPARYPTHPQAEVLVLEPVPASTIRRVCFYSDRARRQWRRSHPGRYAQVLENIPALFGRRRDWEDWQESLAVQGKEL